MRAIVVVAAVPLLVSGLAAGCAAPPPGDDGRAKVPRAVIIGIDGFDWNLVDPLVEAGRMPNMKRLLDAGTRADLLTLVPLEKSPVIWTTIATGRLPGERGRGFLLPRDTEGAPAKAYTSWHRSVRAFWNILSEEGMTVAVLGWLLTWPAEELTGAMVTDYVQYFKVQDGGRAAQGGATYPAGLYDEIEPLVTYPHDVTEADVRPLLGDDPPEKPDRKMAEGLQGIRWILAGDRTFTAIGREFLRNRPEDVVAIYLRGADAVCHQFWGARDNAAAGRQDALTRVFGQTIDRYFAETDAMIGQLLEEIDLDRTTVLIVSDHGFRGSSVGLEGQLRQGIYMHRELGTLLLAGPWAAGRGIRVEGARVQDVLPTLLHALDLPVAEDLDGDACTWLLSREGGADRAIRRIPTYERAALQRDTQEPESPVSDEILERIEALGYVE